MTALLLAVAGLAGEPAPLRAALDAGQLAASIHGNGSSTGDAIFATLSGEGEELTLRVEPGTVLSAARPEAPRMVVAATKGRMLGYGWFQPTSTITVAATGRSQWVFEAYCLELGKRHPQREDRYAIGEVDAELAALIAKAGELASGPAALQTAIWARSADFGVEALRERFPASEKTLDAARALYEAAGHEPCDHGLWRESCAAEPPER